MSNVEKPTEVCVWCMEPAFAIVVPARCESLASGKAAPPKSHAREAGSCILSRLVRLHSSGEIGAEENTDADVSSSCNTNGSK